MRKLPMIILMICEMLMCISCYNYGPQTSDAWDLSEEQIDSLSFYTTHHYTQGYNFIVNDRSLTIIEQQPIEYLNGFDVDTMTLQRNDRIVVAEILRLPADSVDSVWVKVARDQLTMGWLHEQDLLKHASPDNAISRFIDTFSDLHLLVFLGLAFVLAAIWLVRLSMKRGTKIVHLNDINSFYPTMLCLLVASSAVVYSSLQLFEPESWRHFYYHPTLNPFRLPWHLALFIASFWGIVIAGVAAVYDVQRHLPLGHTIIYIIALAAVCAACYVVFSLSTLYYVGYPLLIAYICLSIRQYLNHTRFRYICGNCGMGLHKKGQCPNCGAINT